MLSEHSEYQSYMNIFDEMGDDWETIVNVRDTEKETNFIHRVLPKKGVTLDLNSGTGRHSLNLCRKGWNMIGLDLSRNLLTIAKRNMKKAKRYFPIVRADMRSFPFRDQVFHSVICMFTSFGYLPSENDDIKSFKEIRRTLEINGQFLLDVANRNHIIKVFKEKEWAEYETFYMLEKRSLDPKQYRLISKWTIVKKDTKESRTLLHSVRLYTAQRLKQMLSEAGLRVKEVYGGYDEKKFSSDSTRMIPVAERKK